MFQNAASRRCAGWRGAESIPYRWKAASAASIVTADAATLDCGDGRGSAGRLAGRSVSIKRFITATKIVDIVFFVRPRPHSLTWILRQVMAANLSAASGLV